MRFTIHSTDGAALRGTLTLAHGTVETPVFMPVGTYGTVKAMSPVELKEAGAQIVLGNTFHLWMRPGLAVIEKHGGLHRWIPFPGFWVHTHQFDMHGTEDCGVWDIFSDALAKNSGNIDSFLQSVGDLSNTVRNVSGRVDSTLTAVEDLVKAVDAKKINTILANAEKVSRDVADASGDLKGLVAKFDQTVTTYNEFGKKAQVTLDRVDTLVAAIDANKVKGSVDDIAQATKDARAAVAGTCVQDFREL